MDATHPPASIEKQVINTAGSGIDPAMLAMMNGSKGSAVAAGDARRNSRPPPRTAGQ